MLIAAVVALGFYVAGWRRLRSRGRPDLAHAGRLALFAAGVGVVVLALVSPLDPIGEEYLLSGHMAQHLLLGDVGPVLIVLGLAGPLALFAVPRPVLRTVGRRRPLRAAARWVTRPAVAVTFWIAVMVGWHLPVAFEYALTHRWAHDLEHATMFLAGMLVWLTILGAVPRHRLSPGRRAGIAVGLLAAGMVVSQAIFLSPPLYDVYIDQPERLFGLSPTADQVRAAMMMTTEQILTLGTAAGLLLWSHVDRAADAARAEIAAAGGGEGG